MNNRKLIKHALSFVLPQFRLDSKHGIHGLPHWSRVCRNAVELCEFEGVDPTVPVLFSFFHDSQRYDDGHDIGHGHRASQWLEGLFLSRKLNIKASEFHLLCRAIDGHSFGETEADPIVQVCWDADRLDLGRVGIMPLAKYLCTKHAKNPDMIRRSTNRAVGQSQWSSDPFPVWMR